MKGLWKESVGGWSKDTKRKTQKRKHSLRDNARVLINIDYNRKNNYSKKLSPDIFRTELEMENIPDKPKVKKAGFVEPGKFW